MLPSFTHKKKKQNLTPCLHGRKCRHIIVFYYTLLLLRLLANRLQLFNGNQCIQIIQLLIKQYYYKKIEIQVGPALKG